MLFSNKSVGKIWNVALLFPQSKLDEFCKRNFEKLYKF